MTWAFAIPGDPATPTGGYIYDARVIAAAGGALTALRLPGGFPHPTAADLSATRDALTGAGPAMIDGLAYGALPADLIRALPRRPVALCHHPLGLETGLSPNDRARLIAQERAALALAAHVIVTSDATKRTLLADFGLGEPDVTVAPPGLDRTGAAHGSDDAPVLLTVGSLTQRKGHDVLVDALTLIADLEWRAVWVGPDDRDRDWAAGIIARLARSAIAPRMEIRGAVTDPALREAYAGADIFVLPSRYEGYGMVFDEAMMRGLPVIACAAGAAPDVVPQAAGALVPVDDAASLAAALRAMLEDGNKRTQMGAAARAHALTLPGWAQTWTTIRKVMEAI